MKTVMMLIKRNMLVYSRDKGAIFFSMLAMIIAIALNITFLGKNNVDNFVKWTDISRGEASQFIIVLILSGIIMINCVTSTIAAMNIMVKDESTKKMPVFLVSSTSRFKLSLGYILTAFLASFMVSIFTLGFIQLYLLFSNQILFSFFQLIKIIFIIILNSFASSAFIFFLASFIRTQSAYSGINTLIGTLIGFITGMYIAIGELPSIVQKLLKLIPIFHGTSLLKEAILENMINSTLSNQPAEIADKYLEYMGITLSYNGTLINDSYKIIFLLITGVIFMVLSAFIIKNKEARDR